MVDVAEWLRSQDVTLDDAGSIPVVHPKIALHAKTLRDGKRRLS